MRTADATNRPTIVDDPHGYSLPPPNASSSRHGSHQQRSPSHINAVFSTNEGGAARPNW
ncbi:MAG: hypothetical protein M5T61_09685 [Acidimicrobiia bacterium]|nr:hypothetical protein [Acidimicrobiia bacterium]